jgi:hypothetical protein
MPTPQPCSDQREDSMNVCIVHLWVYIYLSVVLIIADDEHECASDVQARCSAVPGPADAEWGKRKVPMSRMTRRVLLA